MTITADWRTSDDMPAVGAPVGRLGDAGHWTADTKGCDQLGTVKWVVAADRRVGITPGMTTDAGPMPTADLDHATPPLGTAVVTPNAEDDAA